MNKIKAAIGIAAITLLAAGCGSSAASSHPAQPVKPTPVAAAEQNPATAKQVADSLHGTQYKGYPNDDMATIYGMTSNGTFWLNGVKYGVNAFSTKDGRDRWIETAKGLGLVPKWETDTTVTYVAHDQSKDT